MLTFALAAAAAASVVAWALKVQSLRVQVPVPAASLVETTAVDSAAVGKALGAVALAPQAAVAPALASSRFVLAGVAAGRSQQGAALIAVDGKPPKPFEVGAVVGDEWRLRAVTGRQATLVKPSGPNGQAVAGDAELQLALPPAPGSPQ